tara:strand:+ start:410 stop:877 length:468 start_codon:yes stop_codon:yes gene_type:complete
MDKPNISEDKEETKSMTELIAEQMDRHEKGIETEAEKTARKLVKVIVSSKKYKEKSKDEKFLQQNPYWGEEEVLLTLIYKAAKKFENQGWDLLDLVQAGAIGLERSLDKFDPADGHSFLQYSYWWIAQQMKLWIELEKSTKPISRIQKRMKKKKE